MFKHLAQRLCFFTLVISLSGCGYDFSRGLGVDRLQQMLGLEKKETAVEYTPMSDDVAKIAAPESPPIFPAREGEDALPPVFCQVGQGTAHFPSGWFDFDKATFTVAAGEQARVSFPRTKKNETLSLHIYFDDSGQKMVFCPVTAAPPDEEIACSSLYALEDDFTMGIKRTFDVPDAIRGGSISCAYEKRKLKKI